jgi:hypothetical protein
LGRSARSEETQAGRITHFQRTLIGIAHGSCTLFLVNVRNTKTDKDKDKDKDK